MNRRVTVNVPDAPPDEHDGENLHVSVDDRDNLHILESNEISAIYARGFWADVRVEDLET
jgi:hypothetical protein